MRTREAKVGMRVWTATTSGQPVRCRIVGFEEGELVLDSPVYGYVIRRHAAECEPEETT